MPCGSEDVNRRRQQSHMGKLWTPEFIGNQDGRLRMTPPICWSASTSSMAHTLLTMQPSVVSWRHLMLTLSSNRALNFHKAESLARTHSSSLFSLKFTQHTGFQMIVLLFLLKGYALSTGRHRGVRHAEASVFVGFKSLYSKALHNLKSFLYCQSRCVILPERTRDFV